MRAKRKLIVGENDPQRIFQLRELLTNAGYDVVMVNTGPEVLERAAAELPDAILMKEVLKHMNGSMVASLVRLMPSTCSIPVVLYDETRDIDDKKCVWNIPDGVERLTGPIDFQRLLESVQKALAP